MVTLKNSEQLKLLKEAGRITAEALCVARDLIKEGITTGYLDRKIREYIEGCDAQPSFLGNGGFPACACISVNQEVIHGIPSEKVILKEGDIVKVDVGACYRGWHGDSARTFAVGRVSEEAQNLIDVTKECFYHGFSKALAGNRIGDIGCAVEMRAKASGLSVVRDYGGHGVGRQVHEDPVIPNFGDPGRGVKLYPGMVVAIEPMVNLGHPEVRVLKNGWTVVTCDGRLSAHYENTVAITDNGPVILTAAENG